MVLTDTLPTDSVLRRHAESERDRVLGWPPSDSVLRRHHEQWLTANAAPALPTPAATVRMAPVSPPAAAAARATAPVASAGASASRAPASAPPSVAPARPAAAPASGGLFSWLRRVLGL